MVFIINYEDVSLDEIPNKENGPNPRNGFPRL